MADLVSELGKLEYGKGLAESLAGIGKAIGENKRRQEAQNLVAGIMKEITKPGQSLATYLSGPGQNMFQQLQTTEEGRQAAQNMAQQVGLVGGISKASEPIPLGRDQQLLRPNTDISGNAPAGQAPYNVVAENRPEVPRVLTDAEAKRLGLPTFETVENKQYKIQYEGTGSGKTLKSTGRLQPLSNQEFNPNTGRGGSNAGSPWNVEVPEINTSTGGTVSKSFKYTNKRDAMAKINQAVQSLRSFNYKENPSVLKSIGIALGVSDPAKTWQTVMDQIDFGFKNGKPPVELTDKIPPALLPYARAYINLLTEAQRVQNTDESATPAGVASPQSAGSKPKLF